MATNQYQSRPGYRIGVTHTQVYFNSSPEVLPAHIREFQQNHPEVCQILRHNGLALIGQSQIENLQASLATSEAELQESEHQKLAVTHKLEDYKQRINHLSRSQSQLKENFKLQSIAHSGLLVDNERLRQEISKLTQEKEQLVKSNEAFRGFVSKLSTRLSVPPTQNDNHVSTNHMVQIWKRVLECTDPEKQSKDANELIKLRQGMAAFRKVYEQTNIAFGSAGHLPSRASEVRIPSARTSNTAQPSTSRAVSNVERPHSVSQNSIHPIHQQIPSTESTQARRRTLSPGPSTSGSSTFKRVRSSDAEARISSTYPPVPSASSVMVSNTAIIQEPSRNAILQAEASSADTGATQVIVKVEVEDNYDLLGMTQPIR